MANMLSYASHRAPISRLVAADYRRSSTSDDDVGYALISTGFPASVGPPVVGMWTRVSRNFMPAMARRHRRGTRTKVRLSSACAVVPSRMPASGAVQRDLRPVTTETLDGLFVWTSTLGINVGLEWRRSSTIASTRCLL